MAKGLPARRDFGTNLSKSGTPLARNAQKDCRSDGAECWQGSYLPFDLRVSFSSMTGG